MNNYNGYKNINEGDSYIPIDHINNLNEIYRAYNDVIPNKMENIFAVPTCGNCKHFTYKEEADMGVCSGLQYETWTYGRVDASECQEHSFQINP